MRQRPRATVQPGWASRVNARGGLGAGATDAGEGICELSREPERFGDVLAEGAMACLAAEEDHAIDLCRGKHRVVVAEAHCDLIAKRLDGLVDVCGGRGGDDGGGGLDRLFAGCGEPCVQDGHALRVGVGPRRTRTWHSGDDGPRAGRLRVVRRRCDPDASRRDRFRRESQRTSWAMAILVEVAPMSM